jgi:hypothetical protein
MSLVLKNKSENIYVQSKIPLAEPLLEFDIINDANLSVDFTKISQRVGVYSMDATYVDVLSDFQCADMCRNMTGFVCLSFDYCPSTKQCQLSKQRTPDGQLLKKKASCDHYSSK